MSSLFLQLIVEYIALFPELHEITTNALCDGNKANIRWSIDSSYSPGHLPGPCMGEKCSLGVRLYCYSAGIT